MPCSVGILRNESTALLSSLLLLLLHHLSRVRLCATPQMAAHQASRPWDSPGKNTGMRCHFLLQCMKVKSQSNVAQSCPTTLVTPWTAAYQAPPSMGFSRQKYWSGVLLPSPCLLYWTPSKDFTRKIRSDQHAVYWQFGRRRFASEFASPYTGFCALVSGKFFVLPLAFFLQPYCFLPYCFLQPHCSHL